MSKSVQSATEAVKVPETASLGVICAILEEESRQMDRITKRAGIEPVSKGIYPFAKTILAVKDYYKRQATDISSEERQDRARKARNDADSSDIDLAEKRGLLMLRADGKQMWADGMIEMRRALQNLPQFTDRQKREIVEALQSVKLKEMRE